MRRIVGMTHTRGGGGGPTLPTDSTHPLCTPQRNAAAGLQVRTLTDGFEKHFFGARQLVLLHEDDPKVDQRPRVVAVRLHCKLGVHARLRNVALQHASVGQGGRGSEGGVGVDGQRPWRSQT